MFAAHQEHPRLSPSGLRCGGDVAQHPLGPMMHLCPIYGGMGLPVSTSWDGDAAPAGLQLLWQSNSWVGRNPPSLGGQNAPQDGQNPPKMAKISLNFSGWKDP